MITETKVTINTDIILLWSRSSTQHILLFVYILVTYLNIRISERRLILYMATFNLKRTWKGKGAELPHEFISDKYVELMKKKNMLV